jgi:hypothetical protein
MGHNLKNVWHRRNPTNSQFYKFPILQIPNPANSQDRKFPTRQSSLGGEHRAVSIPTKNAAGEAPAALQILNSLVQALRAPRAKPKQA